MNDVTKRINWCDHISAVMTNHTGVTLVLHDVQLVCTVRLAVNNACS